MNSLNMNWLTQARGAGDTGEESSHERPGKFPDLSTFMTVDNGYQPKDMPATQAPVDPGDIIYIKDISAKDTRINDRVMLVLFHNQPFSYTCLSFCRHSDFSGETLHNSHALPFTDQGQQTSPQASPLPSPQIAPQPAQFVQPDIGLSRLEINLGHNHTPFSLQPDIYLNLREHWNIEQEVRLVILGHVERNSYQRLVPEIQRIFCDSLTGVEIVRDRGDPPAPSEQESVDPERKSSRRKSGVYMATRKKGKEHVVIVNSGKRKGS